MTDMLWWVSWEQEGMDCRPVKWPPPESVLAFWESGFSDTHVMVVALVKADRFQRVTDTITRAWSPGIGELQFCHPYGRAVPPGDRFPPPAWSIKLGRWPWT